MSHPTEHKAKKRKHSAAVAEAGTSASEPSTKRSKTDKVKKDKTKTKTKGAVVDAKGKGKEKPDEQFTVVEATLDLTIPAIFSNNLRAGAEEMLDSMIMRYIPALQGVVLAHHNLRFLSSTATIKADCPFANCRVVFEATVWNPYVGMKLVGKVNLCSPDHVALLVHRTFNVSIPRHHIPTDNWEYEHGPAENDPEFAAEEENAEEGAEKAEDSVHGGRWVHKLTNIPLGGPDGRLEFTVIGLTIANQMLSLIGSIQADPFSPEHVPEKNVQISVPPPRRQANEAESDVDEVMGDEPDSENEDTFETLGRLGDAAAEREAAKKAKDEEAKEAKKRKRKEAKAAASAVTSQDGDAQPEKKKKKKKSS